MSNSSNIALNNTAYLFTTGAGLGQKDETSRIGNSKTGNSNIGNNGNSNINGNSNTSNSNINKNSKTFLNSNNNNNSDTSLFSRLNANNGIKRSSTMY